MREIINYFIRNSKWLLFVFYITLSCLMLFQSNPYQHHLYMTSASAVASTVYSLSSNITSYFNLRENNEDLNRRNADLQAEVLAMREQLEKYQDSEQELSPIIPDSLRHYRFIVARVINNSVIRPHNYVTINRGSNSGIRPEMGVIDQNGVVGVVNVVGPNSARIISLLNPNFRLSCKIKNNETFGSLVWDGKDPKYAILEELPRHTVYKKGDTIVTSGYSAVFPPGIPVGLVESDNSSHNENFFSLKIKLLSDFSTLNNVQVVINNYADEIKSVEESTAKEENETKPTSSNQ